MDYTKLRQKVEQEIEEKREQENTDLYNKNMEELNIEIF